MFFQMDDQHESINQNDEKFFIKCDNGIKFYFLS